MSGTFKNIKHCIRFSSDAMLHKLVDDAEAEFVELEDENKKLKEDCEARTQVTIRKMQEIGKLNNEIFRLQAEISDMKERHYPLDWTDIDKDYREHYSLESHVFDNMTTGEQILYFMKNAIEAKDRLSVGSNLMRDNLKSEEKRQAENEKLREENKNLRERMNTAIEYKERRSSQGNQTGYCWDFSPTVENRGDG